MFDTVLDIYNYKNEFILTNISKDFTILGRIRSYRYSFFIDVLDYTGVIQCILKEKLTLKIGYIVKILGTVCFSSTKHYSLIVKQLSVVSIPEYNIQKSYYKTKILSNNISNIIVTDKNVVYMYLYYIFLKLVRDFFNKHSFIEVETPILHNIAGGALATPFVTYRDNKKIYLRIAPELYLKRLIICGFHRIFEIARCFRNEGISNIHNSEFTLLEAYIVHQKIPYMINFVEELVIFLCKNLLSYTYIYNDINNHILNILNMKWEYIKFNDILYQLYGGYFDVYDISILKDISMKFNLNIEIDDIYEIMDNIVSKIYIKNNNNLLHILDHPKQMCPLAKYIGNNSIRFESYVKNVEIVNSYEEQNNAKQQEYELLLQIQHLNKIGHDKVIDYDFINALKYGMSDLVGIGIGIERLFMSITGCPSIRNILPFSIK